MDRPAVETIKGRALRAGYSGVLGKAHIRIPSAVKDGETLSVGSRVFEFDTDDSVVAGRISIDLSGSATASKGTLTIDDTFNAIADETVTIGSRVYTWKETVAAANQVKVGTDAADSAANLAAAINAGAGAGTVYGTGTVAHALVTAVAATRTVVVTAKTPGTGGNAIASTETMTKGAWDAATLGTTQAGVDPTGASAVTGLVAAIAALVRPPFRAVKLGNNDVVLLSRAASARPIALAETMTGSGNVVEEVLSGNVDGTLSRVRVFAVVPSAVEVAAGVIVVPVDEEPAGVIVQVRNTTTGALVDWDGAAAIDGDSGLLLIDNSGNTDWSASHTVSVIVLW